MEFCTRSTFFILTKILLIVITSLIVKSKSSSVTSSSSSSNSKYLIFGSNFVYNTIGTINNETNDGGMLLNNNDFSHGGRVKRRAGSYRRATFKRKGSRAERKLTIYPELAIVVDYELGNSMNKNDLLEYLAIMIANVNDRFALTDDPLIICSIASVNVISNRSAQPFIESTETDSAETYNEYELLDKFQLWVTQRQNDTRGLGPNEHDIVILLTSKHLEIALGIAWPESACQTNTIFSDVSDQVLNYALVVVTDISGTFYASNSLAHEIAHSLGASHDIDHNTEDCKESDGYIMTEKVWGKLEGFRLSPCSLMEIEEYARSPQGNCLHNKNGLRTSKSAKYKTNKREGDLVDAEMICKDIFSDDMKNPVPWYQEPDEFCRGILCWDQGNYSTIGGVEARPKQPGNGMPCGHGRIGKCKNGYCIGDKPTTLDEICKEATGDKSSGFVKSKSQSVCEPNFNCKVTATAFLGTKSKSQLININASPRTGTICGNNGEICFCARCKKPSRVMPKAKCAITTGTDDAKEEPERFDTIMECSSGIKCIFGTEYEWLKKPNNGADCRRGAGNCFEGKCVLKPWLRGHPFTVQEACKLITSDPKTTVISKPSDEVASDDNLCSKLSCRDSNGRIREATSATPEGTICLRNKNCKGGKCVKQE